LELRRHIDLLLKSEGLLTDVVDQSTDAVVVASLSGEILRFNRSAERMFGRTASDTVGQSLTTLMPEEFRAAHHAGLSRLESSGTGKVLGKWLRLRGLRADGTQFPIDLHVSEVGGTRGLDRTVVGIVRDRTEADATQRMREDLLSSVSHELRTPLASSTLFLDLARTVPDIPDAVRGHLDVVSRNIQRLDRLVDDLLLVSSRGSDSFPIVHRTVDVPTVLQESVVAAAPGAESAGKAITLDTNLGPALQGDPGRLGQAFDNLLANALKFSPAGGVVSVRCAVSDGQWIVTLNNSGASVGAEEIEQLFEPFVRGRNALAAEIGGMGLGLTIAASIISRHGGSVDMSSSPREGTTVTVRLPLVVEAEQ
jgi:two-component system phosphate regulon sensor histidine kinase PhoR